MTKEELGDYLRDCRKKMGFTQQFVADILGVERSTYTYYETGKTDVPTKKLFTLAKLYAIDVNNFLTFDGIMLNDPSKEKFMKTEVGMLSKEEKELLAKIRLLGSYEKKSELYQFLEELSKDDKKK